MADRDDPLSDTTPLGKSVEEVEAENQNAVNPSVDSEGLREREAVPPILPAYQNAGEAGMYGVKAYPDVLVGAPPDTARPDDGVNDQDLDDTPQ